ncbi:MAG: ribulose-phosphate 3-epimerase [Clostridia bacterium]|nr:ribulose-phosphate 3-epimerase [Clostridia bacterium]
MREIILAPSLLSANFAHLGRDSDRMEKAGAKILHFDVMDGAFVPNISFGIPVLKSLNKYTDMPMDVHLMIEEPHRYIDQFADAGADYITIHIEAESDIEGTLKKIAERGCIPAISVKPGTPAEDAFKYLPLVKMVLVMSVEPGFGGQSFMPIALDKITAFRKEADRLGLDIDIEVDGGIGIETGKQVIDAGANILVAGSALFNADDPAAVINELKNYGKSK